MRYLEKAVDCYPQSNASDGIEPLASLFLVLYSILCSQWSIMKCYWRCSRGYWRLFILFLFFTFLLLNQEHGVNKERSQSIQSVRHSKRTHRMWPRQKDRSTRKKEEKKEKKEEKKVFLLHSAIWLSSIVQVHAWRSDTVTDHRLSTALHFGGPFWNYGPILYWTARCALCARNFFFFFFF